MPVVAAGLIAVLAGAPASAVPPLSSGASFDFVLGVDPATRAITGYYESGTGYDPETGGPRFTCIFFLRGEATGEPPFRIRTWFPRDKDDSDTIEGEIWADEGGVRVKLKDEHGGCWNVQHFADEGGSVFRVGWEKGAWHAVRVVSAEKTHFHDAPNPAQRRKGYLVTGNPLRIYETKPGWVYGVYEGYNRKDEKVVAKGWIREGDLFGDTPPPPAGRPKAK